MISQVMQQLFGPVLQGSHGDSDPVLGGDQGAEFAGLMAEGDDSPVGAEGATKGATDSPLPIIATPDPAASTPAVIAGQFNLPASAQVAASFQSYEMPSFVALQDSAGESASAASANAATLLPNAPSVLTADATLGLAAQVDAGDGRGPFGQGGIGIDPSLLGGSSAEGLPDFADLAGKLTPPDAPSRTQIANVLDADKVTLENSQAKAANSGSALDGPSGSIPQPSASSTPSAAANTGLQSLHPLAAQSLTAGRGARAGASEPPLAEQPIARAADGPAPLVTLRPFSFAANAALAALQGSAQNADNQAQFDGANAVNTARLGEASPSHPSNAQVVVAVPATAAGNAAGQTPAQITAALFASFAGDAIDQLGTALDESAANSIFGIDARLGFAPSLGTGAAGTVSTGFAGAPPTAAQLSAQLLPLAQSAQSGPVELVLSPAELGQLRFEIHHRGDQVQIVLSAERPETLDLLRRNSEQLLADFRNAGFAGASLAFGGWGAGQNAGANPQEFDQGSQGDGGSGVAQTPSGLPSQNAAFARAQSYLDPSRSLNLRL